MNNNIFRYSGKILLGALIVTGCSDYLKEDSGDLLIPKKFLSLRTGDYQQRLLSIGI